MTYRTLWRAENIASAQSGSFLLTLLRYRLRQDRYRVGTANELDEGWDKANLISSRTDTGNHMPILDLDFPHHYVRSTTTGHGHLFLDVEIPRWRWVVLMIGLRIGGVIEHGTMVWSLRRMGNFVRKPGHHKREDEYSKMPEPLPTYRLRKRNPNR